METILIVFAILLGLAIIAFIALVIASAILAVRSEKERCRERAAAAAAERRRKEARQREYLEDMERLKVEPKGRPAAGTSRYTGTGRSAERRSAPAFRTGSRSTGTDPSFDTTGAAIAASYIVGTDSGSSYSSSSSCDSGSSSGSFNSGSSFSGGDSGRSFQVPREGPDS
ncbi:hypothetical protein ACFQ36_11180 [Arthrobacter sp. GCM10027362]|uniref:hypothetical protein n=1 Tax=Arthrobacter sp. GCM10027362 TaxID=3273379 RepID=UPI00362AC712